MSEQRWSKWYETVTEALHARDRYRAYVRPLPPEHPERSHWDALDRQITNLDDTWQARRTALRHQQDELTYRHEHGAAESEE